MFKRQTTLQKYEVFEILEHNDITTELLLQKLDEVEELTEEV